jgi:serine/threonine protein kinase
MNSLARPLTQSERSEAVLAKIVEEVTNQFHAGQAVEVERYVEAHPELAEQIRQLVPALQVLAELGQSVACGDKAAVRPTDVAPAELGELGDFRLLREVGRGGMGVVYEAEQISLNRRVALKVLPFAAALDPKQLQRFKNEAQAAAHLQHTNIVPVHYVGCERGVHFYAMQYIDGQTLAKVIADLRRQNGGAAREKSTHDEQKRNLSTQDESSLPPCAIESAQSAVTPTPQAAAISTEVSTRSRAFFRAVAQLGEQAAEALEHAHQLGVIHRDIKPANLLVDAGGRLWVTDFGLAHCRSQSGLTMTGDLLGTLRYMSPEQALAKRVLVDARTDVYSLGVTLYELLTLEPAYNGSNREEVLRQIAFEEPCPLHRLNDAIPPELDTITLKAMAKNPEERYATAQELADDLRRYLEDKPIKAKRPLLRQRAAKWARRHSTVVRAAVVVLVLAVVGLALSTALIWQSLERERQSSYYQRIALAEREWSANDLNRVEELLDACPVDLRGWEWHYLKRLQYQTPPILQHDCMPLRVAFSPTGQCFASGSSDGTIRIWDAQTYQVLHKIPAHKEWIYSLAFSPDGEYLASGSVDKFLTIWKVRTGEKIRSWIPHGGDVSHLAFSPDGRYLASGGGRRKTG